MLCSSSAVNGHLRLIRLISLTVHVLRLIFRENEDGAIRMSLAISPCVHPQRAIAPQMMSDAVMA